MAGRKPQTTKKAVVVEETIPGEEGMLPASGNDQADQQPDDRMQNYQEQEESVSGEGKADQQPDGRVQDDQAQKESLPGEEGMLPGATDPVDGLWIKSKSAKGRWRAGLHFTKEPIGIALCALTDDQIGALKDDPMLVVEEVTFTDDDAANVLRATGAE